MNAKWKRPRSKRKPVRKTYRSRSSLNKKIATIARRTVLKTAETKHRLVNFTGSLGAPYPLNHNVSVRVHQNILQTAQGTNDGPTMSRIGDEVYFKGIKLSWVFHQPTDRPQTIFKVWVVKGHYNHLPGSLPVKDGSLGNLLIDPVNTERVTVLANKTFRNMQPNTQVFTLETVNTTFTRKMWIPFNKKYTYDANDGYHGKYYSIAVYVAAYDTWSALPTDVVGSYQMTCETFFKDP